MPRKLKAVSLFSGIGAASLGCELHFDCETVAFVEQNPYCQKVLARHWPGVPIYDDVTQVGKHNLPDFDILEAGFPCFPAGTPITTKDGTKAIEDIQDGDLVLTHTGQYKSVVTTMRREGAELLRVTVDGQDGVECTAEHPFYVKAGKDGQPEWVEAKDLGPWHQAAIIPEALPDLSQQGAFEDCILWCPVRRVESVKGVTTVYNFEVADDNSYVAGRHIVHNCQDLSTAGRQKGLLNGERSALFFDVIRIAQECGPEYVFCENVPALWSQWAKEVDEAFESIGYGVAWAKCAAGHTGTPHQRWRVFLLAKKGAKHKGMISKGSLRGRTWPTPLESDAKGVRGAGSLEAGGLSNIAEGTWPTPVTSDTNEGRTLVNGQRIASNGERYGAQLSDITREPASEETWPTPRAGMPGSRAPGTGGKVLAEEVTKPAGWPTPKATDGDKGTRTPEAHAKERDRQSSPDLPAAVAETIWPTPNVFEYEDQSAEGALRRITGSHQVGMEHAVLRPSDNDVEEVIKDTPVEGASDNPLFAEPVVEREVEYKINKTPEPDKVDQTEVWPTPDASTFNDGQKWSSLDNRMQRNGSNYGAPLAMAVKPPDWDGREEPQDEVAGEPQNWQTPRVAGAHKDAAPSELRRNSPGLAAEVQIPAGAVLGHWATPRVATAGVSATPGEVVRDGPSLGAEVQLGSDSAQAEWPTPTAQPKGSNTMPRGNPTLKGAVQPASAWPTPSTQDPGVDPSQLVDKDGNPPEHSNQRLYDKDTGRHAQKGLTQAVQPQQAWATPAASGWSTDAQPKTVAASIKRRGENPTGQTLDEQTIWPTDEELDAARVQGNVLTAVDQTKKGRLNPDWVEVLQGLPVGWTKAKGDSMIDEGLKVAKNPRWPAPMIKGMWGDSPQFDWEPPRTINPKRVKNRIKRLKTLGNCNPPQQYLMGLGMLAEVWDQETIEDLFGM